MRRDLARFWFFKRTFTGRQEDHNFHGGIFVLVDAQAPQVVRKVDHALDARTQAESARLLQRDRLAVRDADLARRRHRPVAAGEQQQLAPRVDQQRYLVVNLSSSCFQTMISI